MKEAVKNEVGIDIVMIESPVGDHQGNGVAEAAVKQVQGQVRTMKDALEARYQTRVTGDMCVVPGLVMHAAAVITR